MGTLRATNIQHADAAAVGILLAADGTVGGLRPTQNTQSGTTYSLSLADSGRTVTLSNAAPVTVTLPAQATVAWNAGETVSLLNLGVGTVTVVAAAGVTINGTPLTLATSKGGSLVRTASNVWTFIPFSAGSAKATVSATTGSPTITTVGTKTVYQFTGSGTITVAAGEGEILVVSAGSGPNASDGLTGTGGKIIYGTFTLPAGTLTVTVGAGGQQGGTGSRIDTFIAAANPMPRFVGELTGAGSTALGTFTGFTSSITGGPVVYAPAADATKRGGGATGGGIGANGIVIISIG